MLLQFKRCLLILQCRNIERLKSDFAKYCFRQAVEFLRTMACQKKLKFLPGPHPTTDKKRYILLHFYILVELFPTYVFIRLAVEIIFPGKHQPAFGWIRRKQGSAWLKTSLWTDKHLQFDSMLPAIMTTVDRTAELASHLLKLMKTNQEEHSCQEHLKRSSHQIVSHLWKRITVLFRGFGKLNNLWVYRF